VYNQNYIQLSCPIPFRGGGKRIADQTHVTVGRADHTERL